MRIGVTADQITWFGAALSLISGLFIYRCDLGLGLLFLALGGCCDFLDGAVARASGKSGRFGAFLDSTLDRYSEMFVYVGLVGCFFRQGSPLAVLGAVLALGGSFLVSYARAKAEGLGYQCAGGLAQRPERLVLLGLGLLAGARFLPYVVWLIALLSHVTAVQRMMTVQKSSSTEGSSESGSAERRENHD